MNDPTDRQSAEDGRIDRLAREAIAKQVAAAGDLEVRVHLNPGNLARGNLDGIDIFGREVATDGSARANRLDIRIGEIAIDRGRALLGDLTLREPSRGQADIVLTAADIEAGVRERFRDRDGSRLDLNGAALACDLANDSLQLAIEGKLCLQTHLSAGTAGLDVTAGDDSEGDPEAIALLCESLGQVLNLRHFDLGSIELTVRDYEWRDGSLALHANLRLQELPL